MAIEWAVENVRLSLFSSAAANVTEQDWQKLTGQQEAEARQAIPGGRIFGGRYEGAQLSLSGTNNRADIILTSPPPELTDEPRLPTFGAWAATRDMFVQLTKKWQIAERFPLVRVAFGAVLLSRADSKVDAYSRLKNLLSSVSVDPEQMRDLVYRINWPITSKVVQGLTVNRITNWGALQIQIQQVSLHEPAGNSVSVPKHAVRLELDHSTDAARKETFAAGDVEKVYAELVTLASENAAKGEKP